MSYLYIQTRRRHTAVLQRSGSILLSMKMYLQVMTEAMQNLSGLFQRQMDDGISIFLIKADRGVANARESAGKLGPRE